MTANLQDKTLIFQFGIKRPSIINLTILLHYSFFSEVSNLYHGLQLYLKLPQSPKLLIPPCSSILLCFGTPLPPCLPSRELMMQFFCHLIRVRIPPWHNWVITCQGQRVHELFENQNRVTHISYICYLAQYVAISKFSRYILGERERERV